MRLIKTITDRVRSGTILKDGETARVVVNVVNKKTHKFATVIGTYRQRTFEYDGQDGPTAEVAVEIHVAGVEEPTVLGFVNRKGLKEGAIKEIIDDDVMDFKVDPNNVLIFAHKIVDVKSKR